MRLMRDGDFCHRKPEQFEFFREDFIEDHDCTLEGEALDKYFSTNKSVIAEDLSEAWRIVLHGSSFWQESEESRRSRTAPPIDRKKTHYSVDWDKYPYLKS